MRQWKNFQEEEKYRKQNDLGICDKEDFTWIDKIVLLSVRNIWLNAGICFISEASDIGFAQSWQSQQTKLSKFVEIANEKPASFSWN